MKERIQKILSTRAVTSRRQAEEMIRQGRVSVNGKPASLGQQADPDTDQILIDGTLLPGQPERIYLMLNKPRGVVTTLSDERGRMNAAELVSGCGQRVWPIGRLDMDSEGLLLFTNDGAFSQEIAHPRSQVDKCYHVWVSGYTPERETLLRRQVVLDGYTIAQPVVRLLKAEGSRACLAVTIHEGRNRQVRRMCALAELEVNRLKRVAEGSLHLGKLPSGKWRYLTSEEVRRLRQDG